MEDQDPEFARAKLGNLQVDLLFTSNKLFEHVRRRHIVTQQFVERSVPCATVEGLLLLKLFALPALYRQGRFDRVRIFEGDVAGLLDTYRPNLAPLFAQLGKHVSASDLVELRRIVAEIEQRNAEQRRRFGRK